MTTISNLLNSRRAESPSDVTGTTGSLVTPTGTTAQRDGIPAEGYFRFNSTMKTFEGFDGTDWIVLEDTTKRNQARALAQLD